jgi:heme-degrading monooxygenase HmoA
MADVNVVNWHVNPFRADRWYSIWMPALERAPGFGAISYSLTRSEEDHLFFLQTTVWEDRSDFDRFWSSDEVAEARTSMMDLYNKPVYPVWHVAIASERVG